ncbi:Csu type fimbrial protein [Vibrio diabolicus]
MELHMKIFCLIIPLLFTVLSLQTRAETISGTIDVSINLVEGCVINGNNAVNGSSNIGFGSLNFGDVPAIFTEQDAVLTGEGGTGIEILCSNGVTPTFSLVSGANDPSSTTGNHAMTNGSEFVDYTLFTDSDRSTQFTSSNPIALSTFNGVDSETINLYATAYGTSSVAGNYVDTLNVTLSW